MKLIYKTNLPFLISISIVMVGISYFSRASLKDALLSQELERIKITTQSALLAETELHEEPEEIHEAGHEESEEYILTIEHLESPFSTTTQNRFRRYLEEFKDPTIVDVSIISKKKQIVYSNAKNADNITLGSNVDLSLAGKSHYVDEFLDQKHILKSYIPLILEGEIAGSLLITSDLTSVFIAFDREVNKMLLRLIVTGLLTFLIIFLIEQRMILRPIAYLQSQAKLIGEGNLSEKIKFRSNDEFGELSQFFEQMRKRLKISWDKKTQEVINEHAKLVASIQSLPFGYMIVDDQKNILTYNTSVSSILNTKKQEKPDFKQLQNILKGQFNLAVEYENSINKKQIYVSAPAKLKDKFLKIGIYPIVAEKVIGSVIILEDITAQTLLERNKEEFFAVASHELRTPLTSIRGNMSLIQTYYKKEMNNPEILGIVDETYKASMRLIRIVNDFLDASRLEQKKSIFKFDWVDLDKTLAATLKDFNEMAHKKSLKIVYNSKKDLPKVWADNDRVKQIIYNLVGNAINYTQKGQVEINIEVLPNFLKVLVKDTGVGIPPENYTLLFKKFQQAGQKIYSRDVSSGAGMGLYISKLMIDNMGGEIGLVESSNKGSIFYFTIPTIKSKI